ncbi:MAG: helix-turn-helix domain-containing protein [Desulfurococcales archaeon]|nr:helix-turn-helix domain-containing protein [Desulfurococcales archaeon]
MVGEKVNKRVKYRRRIEAGMILAALREEFKLKELEAKTGLPISLLSRYATGDILPSEQHVEKIEELLNSELVSSILLKYIETHGRLAVSHKLASNPLPLWLAAKTIQYRVIQEKSNFNVIITPEVGGIPIAVLLSHLSGAKLVIARKKRYLNWSTTLAGIGGTAENIRVYYVDKRELDESHGSILVVDDIIVEGYTMESIFDLLKKAGVKPCCAYSIYGVGSLWKEKFPDLRVLAEVNQ